MVPSALVLTLTADLPAAAMRKIQKNGEKYPAPIVRGSRAKYNEYHKNQ
jgi:hypothetical protein